MSTPDLIAQLVALILAIFGSTGFWTWLSNRHNRKSAATKLLLGLAYDKIIWLCNKYISQGFITADEYNELNRYLFEPYETLEGNGTAKKLMGEVRGLPTTPAQGQETESAIG